MSGSSAPAPSMRSDTDALQHSGTSFRSTSDTSVPEDAAQQDSTVSSDTLEANMQLRRDWYSTVATFAAGGVAGAASRTLTAPLDRVKIIVQEGYLVQAPAGTKLSSRKNPGLVDVVRLINADGGWKAFWRGNLINCLKAGPEFAIVFSLRRYFTSLYEDCIEREKRRIKTSTKQHTDQDERNRLIGLREEEERNAMRVSAGASGPTAETPGGISEDPSDNLAKLGESAHRKWEERRLALERKHDISVESSIFPPPFNRLGCLSSVPRLAINCTIGAGAGLGAQAIVYPMEVIKTRIVVSKSSEYRGGAREVIRRAYRHGGVQEFYRGFAPNMAGIIVYRGLEMGIYSSLQQSLMLYRMQWQHKSRHDAALSTAEVGIAGMVASIVSQTVSYPFNVVRTRLQTQGTNGREKSYNGMVDCMTKMIRNKGVRSLFSGLMANYLKAVPASTCAFMVFEKTQTLLLGDD